MNTKNSALYMAVDMRLDMLTEEQYRELQPLGKFDAKTSSWIITPPGIRKLGGAIFADFRYNQVFVLYPQPKPLCLGYCHGRNHPVVKIGKTPSREPHEQAPKS